LFGSAFQLATWGEKMSTDWKTLRAELPQDVLARLDEKRETRRLGNAQDEDAKQSELILTPRFM
jgi:uncharacterized lipoprotein